MKPFHDLLLPLLLMAATAFAPSASAQEPSTMGTEFYVSFPTNWAAVSGVEQYIRLSMTAPYATTVRIYIAGVERKTLTTIANSIVSYDLTKLEAQAVNRSDLDPVPNDQVYRTKAIRVVAERPIALHGINHTTYTADGMLILPTSALGREYIVASAPDVSSFGSQRLPSQLIVIAPYDGTVVTIVTPARTPNHAAGSSHSITLNSGDVYSMMSADTDGDLTGATVSASKPVAVTAGSMCAYLPTSQYPACDHLVEMMLPVESWGRHYQAIPYAGRLKGDLFRVFASEPDTDVFINGNETFSFSRRGGTMGEGWAEFLPPDRSAVDFTSTKPIMVVQYNNSQTYDGAAQTDPFYTVLFPVEQYLASYSFATAPAADFENNYLTIISDSIGFRQIEITNAGGTTWRNLAQTFPQTIRSFAMPVDGRTYVGTTFRIDPGAYSVRGTLPFTGSVYGTSNFESYGFPLGGSVADLANTDTVAPVFSRGTSSQTVVDGTISDMPDDSLVRSNLADILLLRDASTNVRLTVGRFEAGVSRSTTFAVNVIDPTQSAIAVVRATDRAGNSAYDTLRFAAGAATGTIVAGDRQFGAVSVGAVLDGTVSIENRSATVPLIIAGIEFAPGSSNTFTVIDAPAFPLTLQPSASVQIMIRFTPTSAAEFNASIIVHNNASPSPLNDSTIVLSGRGVGLVFASSHDFGELNMHSQSIGHGTITIHNRDAVPVRLIGIARREGDSGAFAFPNPSSYTNVDIAPNDSIVIPVEFRPSTYETYSARIYWAIEPARGVVASDLTGKAMYVGASADEGSALAHAIVQITPNPVRDDEAVVSVRIASGATASIELIDVDGRVVRRHPVAVGSTSVRLDLADISSGIYFVRLRSDNDVVSRPMIISR